MCFLVIILTQITLFTIVRGLTPSLYMKISYRGRGKYLLELDNAIPLVLKNYRKAACLSQERLAYESGLDRTYISFLERGLRKPTIHTLFRLCSALDVQPSTFIQEVEKLIENTTDSNINR